MSHSSQLFNSLATEVLDHICSFIPSPRDLLSFALCQRRLSAIIVPSHIQFRDLVLSLSHRSLIRKLPERPLLASRFVSLEYASNSKSFIWPASLLKNLSAEWPVMGKGDQRRILDEVSKELVPGIQCLVGLTSFRCDLHATGMADPIFTALQESCPALTTLELVYSSYSGPSRSTVSQLYSYKYSQPRHISQVWDFSNLTRFSCTLWGPFYDDEHTKRAFMMLTDRCPRLEELQFSHTSVLDITALAETGRWPHLRSLALGAMGDSATITLTNPILNEFIKAQPRLERLYVNCSGTPLLVHDLPSLRSLHLGLGVTINKKKKFPVSKTLEFLAIDFICDFEGYIHFLKQRPPLRALVVAPDQIRRVSDFIKTFVHFVPDLEKFHWNQEIKDSCTHNHDV